MHVWQEIINVDSEMPLGREVGEDLDWGVFAKYFVHGIAFSFLFLLLGIVTFLLFVVLVAIGSFIGFLIGLLILMLAIGVLNCFLAEIIWSAHTKMTFGSLLFHGVALFSVLFVVNGLLVAAPNWVIPSMATIVVTFIVGAFAGGVVGKKVAGLFEVELQREEIPETVKAQGADQKL
jgi:hypothetical protein